MIPLARPTVEADDIEAVRLALESGYLVQGARVRAFEAGIAGVTGTTHAVAVSSGTAALHLALLALGVGAGDRVAVPAYSFIATANSVAVCGAEPVFVDIEPDHFSLDPVALRAVAERGPLRAVMPVHPFGHPADVPAIAAAVEGVPIVEDAAAALGARLGGKAVGGLGVAGCFSFHPRKSITTGEGGAVTTDDDGLADRVRALRNHGQSPTSAQPEFILPGLNYRLGEIAAALGVTQLAKRERIERQRRDAAARYDALLAGGDVRPPARSPDAEPVVQSYVVMLPAGVDRDGVIARLRSERIETQIGTWHMPLSRYYRERYGYRAGDFPVTDEVFARTLTLPLYPGIGPEDQARVVARLVAALET